MTLRRSAATAALSGIVDVEMDLHVRFCADWGLTEAELASAQAMEATAYTRYVFERGMAGDLLDCMWRWRPASLVTEKSAILSSDRETVMEGNPYRSWIEMYAGDEYQDIARGSRAAGPVGGGERGRCAFQRSGGDLRTGRVWKRPLADGSRCLIYQALFHASDRE